MHSVPSTAKSSDSARSEAAHLVEHDGDDYYARELALSHAGEYTNRLNGRKEAKRS
jgi:hypothetical protein